MSGGPVKKTGYKRPRHLNNIPSRMYDSMRALIENRGDDVFEQAATLINRSVLRGGISIDDKQVLLSHFRGINPANNSIIANVHMAPRTRVIQGLKQLGVVTDTVFRPKMFKERIIDVKAGYVPVDRSDRNYAWMKYHDLIVPIADRSDRSKSKTCWQTTDRRDGSPILNVPFNNVYDLPTSLFMYVLNAITQGTINDRKYNTRYTITPSTDHDGNAEEIVSGPLSRSREGDVPLDDVLNIFNRIIGKIHTMMNGFAAGEVDRLTWNGSDESGTSIILIFHDGRKLVLEVKLILGEGTMIDVGGKWTDEIASILDEVFPSRCYLTVKNVDDEQCLLYCMVLGMMCYENRPWMVAEDKVIEPWTIRSRGMMYSNLETVRKVSKEILEGGPVREAVDLLRSENYSIQEFQEKAKGLEDLILGKNPDVAGMGFDFYVMDYGTTKHIFPVYMSKRCIGDDGKHIKLLNVKSKDGLYGHYILITDMDEVMRRSGGKIFFNCSKCNASFYTQGGMKGHLCVGDIEHKDGLAWSRYNMAGTDCDHKGYCERCMLKFATEFEYYYHRENCFMKGKTGFRHVHCISIDDCHGGIPALRGVTVDEEVESARNAEEKLFFADFESFINPETGEHSIMSYGVFDEQNHKFEIGYSIEEFVMYMYRKVMDYDEIKVYFHNAMNYDANFILRYVLANEWTKKWNIRAIMKSSSRLQTLSFSFNDDKGKKKVIHIGDTFLFLTLSLERIVSSIRKPDLETNMNNFTRFFEGFLEHYPGVTAKDVDMILRKNIFPYKFFTEESRLDTPTDEFIKIFLPLEENLKYFSENVDKSDLERQYHDVEYVMGVYGCKTARDYHDIYLRCDVLQIADVFMNAIHTLWESHHIFLPNFVGMPAASWGAFLRHNPDMSIPLYTNTIFAEFFSTMTRGGVTSAPLRYAVADSTHSIIYLDVNGLYPYVMQAYKYPCGFLAWQSYAHIKDDVNLNDYLMNEIFPQLERDGEGLCLTVDLIYPSKVKIATDDYPFAPEHRLIHDEYFDETGELTGFLQQWSAANDHEKMSSFMGLVGTVYDKEKYTVHWRLLKWYIEHGLIVNKLYWGVRFREGDYLADYVRLNIRIRNERKDELGKMVYKLMGNSIYGKTFESPFKRATYKIVTDGGVMRGMLEEKSISSLTPIDNLGWVVKMDGEEIVLNKPTYIGACVCEYAKLHMYTLLYDKLRRIFPKVELVYTDTDSFIVRVEHEPELEDDKKLFAYIKSQEPDLIGGIGGQVKSETGEDDTIREVIALRSKVYAYVTKSGHIGKRAKGTTHAAQETQLDWETYKEALFTLKSVPTRNVQFVRKQFNISTIEMLRQSLSVNDSKRCIMQDGIHTHAWGYPFDEEGLL